MTFPDTPLDLRAELQIDSVWTDVSSRLDHGPITIGRGHPDESTTVSQSTLAMTLTNSDGALASKNPTGPYYPWLKRNTPCRISIPAQMNYLRLEDDNTSYASCPDASRLDITGNLDLQLDLKLTDWTPCTLASKWNSSTNKAWALYLRADGTLGWEYYSSAGDTVHYSQAPLPVTSGRFAIRVAFYANNGSGGYQTHLYTAPTIAGPWTEFGEGIPTSGTVTLNTTTAPVCVGYSPGYIVTDNHSAYTGPNGQIYEFRLYNGISGSGGTLVADAVFSSQAAGATGFTDSQGNTWTMNGTAEISSRAYLGHFEAAGWPQHQNPAGTDTTVAVSGGGLLRRLGQRNTPLNSAMYRAYTRITDTVAPIAYWPMEDGADATQLASGIGGLPMYFSGPAQLASSSDFACSDPLPVTNGAMFTGTVPPAASWTDNVVRFLMALPSGGEADASLVAVMNTTGTVARAVLRYDTGGALALTGWDASNNQLFTTGPVSFNLNGQPVRVSMSLQASGSNVAYQIETLAPGANSGQAYGGTLTGASIGKVTQVQLNPGGGLTQTVMGHCSVQAEWDDLFDLDAYVTPTGLLTGALSAWTGEPAAVRFARLCSEEGIQCRMRGILNDSALMGPQTSETLTTLLQECADADRGVWYELAQQLGWGYITRTALYNQSPAVTVTYDEDNLSLWSSDPTEDDQTTLNDLTLSNQATGASVRVFAATGQPVTGGRLSTASPPAGIGTYDNAPTTEVNLWRDGDLAETASWMIWLGTTDQPRFPGIVLDLTNRALASLFYAIVGMELGDVLEMDNLPAWLPPDPVRQLAQQFAITAWYDTLQIIQAGVPESPYEVAVAAAPSGPPALPTSRADTAGSQLASAAAAGTAPTAWSGNAGWASWNGSNATVAVSGGNLVITSTSSAAGAGFWQAYGAPQACTAGQKIAVVATITAQQALGAVGIGIHLSGGSDTYTASSIAVAAGQTVTVCVTATAATGQTSWQPYIIDSEGSAAGLVMTASIVYGGVAGTLSVAVTAGNLWTTNSSYFPFDVQAAGERITVAAISGTSSPQAFTVLRAVNGVSKAQAAAAPLSLWNPPVAAL